MKATPLTAAAAFGASNCRHHHTSSIPHHNAGDHDAEANGGPSDGDGNV